jgi:hypothetical protein
MKRIIFLAISLFCLTTVRSQDIVSGAAAALRAGNAKELTNYMHGSVDLTLLQKEGAYSKAQAEQVIQEFFNIHKPSAFKQQHSGSSADGSKYLIGNLETSKGVFRVYMLFKNISGKELIQTLRFESSN